MDGKMNPDNLLKSIEELDLSTRSYLCLQKENIKTVADIIGKTKNEIAQIKNLGPKSLGEIRQKLWDMGLSFKKEKLKNEKVLLQIESLDSILRTLTFREELVIRLRFGLGFSKIYPLYMRKPKLTLRKTGEFLGLTQERIRQIEYRAIRKLKHPLQVKKLKLIKWEGIEDLINTIFGEEVVKCQKQK